jgi:hypothetical protein
MARISREGVDGGKLRESREIAGVVGRRGLLVVGVSVVGNQVRDRVRWVAIGVGMVITWVRLNEVGGMRARARAGMWMVVEGRGVRGVAQVGRRMVWTVVSGSIWMRRPKGRIKCRRQSR